MSSFICLFPFILDLTVNKAVVYNEMNVVELS